MNTGKIFIMTHKHFTPPDDPLYVPLHVGKNGEDFNCLRDDCKDNIAERNIYYSELTGLYWVWKNIHEVSYVGTCHYRRYLISDTLPEHILTDNEIRTYLKTYDLITTKRLDLNYTYYDGFKENHKPYYLDETRKAMARVCPAYIETYDKLVHEKHTYFGNMLIATKEVYDAYASWLFSILFSMESHIQITETDAYHRRIFGFISEFLLYVYVTKRHLKVKECKVGMVGEKAETGEIKKRLAEYFEKKDVDGARAYFMECKTKRPDILMEASDITGELHLCMEIIAIAGLEKKAHQRCILDVMNQYEDLISFCRSLNHYTIAKLQQRPENGQEEWERKYHVTEEAKTVAEKMFANVKNPYQYIH